ncbi:MAG: hypothetical protein U0326_23405 [Polyangiales bacterium]
MTLRTASLSALLLLAASCDRARPAPRPSVRPEAHDAAPPRALASITEASLDAAPDVAIAAAPAPAPTEPLPEAIPSNAAREEPFGDDDLSMRRPMTAVPLPSVPPELEADARRYRALTNRSMRCWEADGRVSHSPGRACEGYYAQLAAGGLAAVHGIGRYIVDDGNRRLFQRERDLTRTDARDYEGGPASGSGTLLNTAPRLSHAFARLDAPEVVPYVLAAMSMPIARGFGDWGGSDEMQTWMRVLVTVTGNDLTPMPPWQFIDLDMGAQMRFLGDSHDTWARWYRAHRNESLAEWRAQGLARARTDLTGRDVARRVAAILRLGDKNGPAADQEAARLSLVELLAQRRLSNAGRRYMRDFAAQNHWSLEASGDAGVDAGDAALPRSTS